MAAFRRLAAVQSSAFSTLSRSGLQQGSEACVVNAAKASLTVPNRGFAAEPAPAPTAGKGYVKQVCFFTLANPHPTLECQSTARPG